MSDRAGKHVVGLHAFVRYRDCAIRDERIVDLLNFIRNGTILHGKTSAMAHWWLARVHHAVLPCRLVYVIESRTVVPGDLHAAGQPR